MIKPRLITGAYVQVDRYPWLNRDDMVIPPDSDRIGTNAG